MKLEAVNPVDPEEVCIATVTKLKDSYLWLQLEGKPDWEEKCSTYTDYAVVPSSNLKSIWNKLTTCWILAANHCSISKNTANHLFALPVSRLALYGSVYLSQARIAFVHCSVSVRG